MLKKVKKIHFVGIGGIGMSGIAQICLRMGFKVSGSDLKMNESTARLAALGAEVYEGHKSDNVSSVDLLVYSSAVSAFNPELKIALKKRVNIVKRAQLLAELMKEKTSFAVAGAHGKTTTSSMLGFLLKEAGYNPTVCVGGVVRNFENNSILGDSQYFVAEADESDGSFLYYRPDYTILTNIDYEHIDYFRNWNNILKSYRRFINNLNDSGLLVCCGDDPNIMKILKGYKKNYLLYGFSKEFDLTARNLEFDGVNSGFNCIYKNKDLGRVNLNIPGKHNILNALSVIGIGLSLGLEFSHLSEIISRYQGAERRFHIRFNSAGLMVADDYGHHPSEIKATLQAAKGFNTKRIVVVFQPHRYTRTKALFNEFCSCFALADELVITDIYAASEKPIKGVASENICAKILENGGRNVRYMEKGGIVSHLLKILDKGDLCLFLGAGDIYKLSIELSNILRDKLCVKNLPELQTHGAIN